jgi:ketosteroid isomerase-like protein
MLFKLDKLITVVALLPTLNAVAFGQDDTAVEIRQLEEELNSAFNRYDAGTLDRLWSEDLSFIMLNGSVATKAQRLAGLGSRPANIPESVNESVDVKMYGDVAVAVVLSRWSGKHDGLSYATYYRATHVWARQTGGWKLVAAQVSQVKN